MLCSATESIVGVPRRPHVHRAVGAPPQHRDLGKPAPSGPVAAHVCQHLDGRRELAGQRLAVEATERGESLQPRGNLGGAVGVHRARAAVVAGLSDRAFNDRDVRSEPPTQCGEHMLDVCSQRSQWTDGVGIA